jgi:capsular exopolysaccharide synthesis family protein
MESKKPLSFRAASREVSLQLWPATPDEGRRPPDWNAVHGTLIRRLPLLLGTFAGTLLFCLLVLWMLPPVYRANATLQVNTSSAYSNENDLPVLSAITGANQGQSLITQTQILQNDAVRDRAMSRLKTQGLGAASIVVKAIPETDLITVSGSSRDPRAAAALPNAVIAAYLQLSRDKNRAQYSTARHFVGLQLNTARARLNLAREDLQRYKQRNGTVDLATETQSQIEELGRIQSEWRQARANKEAARAQLTRVQNVAATLPRTVVSQQVTARRPAAVAMQARLTQLELERLKTLEEFQPGSPEVRALEGEIAGLRERMRNEVQTQIESSQEVPNPALADAQQTILRLQGEIRANEARGVELKSLTQQMQADLARLPEREAKLGQLTTDLAGLQQSYQTLNQKYQTLRASEAARVASGSLLFAAKPPTKPVRRLTPFNIGLSLVFASLLALALTTLADRVDKRVRSPRDLPFAGDLPVLAQIPYIADPTEQCLTNTKAMVSPLLENYRTLRTMLALSSPEEGEWGRTLAVTSSLPQEGKSLVSVNLAVAAALGGERVILVDCNLRAPTLHLLCGRSNSVGFIDVANGEAPLDAALQATRIPGLRLLTSGTPVSNPFRALNSRAGRELLERLAQMADFVVIDTPPVLVMADARVTGTLADSVLLVVSTQEPNREDVATAAEALAQSGAQISALCLTKCRPARLSATTIRFIHIIVASPPRSSVYPAPAKTQL